MHPKIFTGAALYLIIIINSGCPSKSCVEAKYQFYMQQSFSIERDSILVSDTLWLYSSHSTTFRDSVSGNQIDFSNSQIGVNLSILNFPDTSQSPIGAIYNFNFINVFGRELSNVNLPTQNKGFIYDETNGNYTLKLGFIAKVRGIYAFFLGNSNGVIKNNHSCEKAGIEITNSNSNNHLYYYQNFRPGYEIPSYEKTHIYCVKVK